MRSKEKNNLQGGFDLKIWRLKEDSQSLHPRIHSVGFLFSAVLLLSSLGAFCQPSAVLAEESQAYVSAESKDLPYGERKTLSGKVSAANKEGLAIVTKVDAAKSLEKEIWLPFADGIRLNGYNDVTDVLANDEVVAIYEEGGGSKRLLRELTFVQRPPEEPEAIEAPAPDEEAPQEPAEEGAVL